MNSISEYATQLCARLGMGPAIDPGWRLSPPCAPHALRFIFMPSFHPHGVMTLTELSGIPRGELRFAHGLRSQTPQRVLDYHAEQFLWPAARVPDLLARFDQAAAAVQAVAAGQWIALDGTPVACIYCHEGQCCAFEANRHFPAFNDLQTFVLQVAWELVASPFLRNRLAACLPGADTRPHQPEPGEPGQPLRLQVAVLGSQNDRADLALALAARTGAQKPIS